MIARQPRRSVPVRLLVSLMVGLLAATAVVGSMDAADAAPRGRGGDLKHSALYRAKALTSVGCAPASSVALNTDDGQVAYYGSVITCMNKAWKKKLRKVGVKFAAPKLVVHHGDRSSPCGGALTISFYCGLNKTIYMYADEIANPWNQYDTDYSHGLTRLAATHTVAHEYGHHLQQLSGILRAIGAGYRGQKERRSELQASCLGNVFLSSQRDAYPIAPDYAAMPSYWRYITVANHGSTANQAYWTDRGYLTAKARSCNTFKASKSAVS